MKILLIGANGQLGTDLLRTFQNAGDTVLGLTHAEVEVCSEQGISEVIAQTKPDVVINTAAFHKVEECELKPLLALQVNGLGALNLARSCHREGAILVHFSTDYVFDGSKKTPYEENDLPSPLNVYGVSKVMGEQLIACNAHRYFVIRACGLYGLAGSSGKGGNFVENMLKKGEAGQVVRVVDDQVLTPTYTVDLAVTARNLILTEKFGLYHVSSEGECSWYEFTKKIFENARIVAQVTPVKSSEFPSPVKRPSYSVLSKAKLRNLGLSIPTWHDALARYYQARAATLPAPSLPLSRSVQ